MHHQIFEHPSQNIQKRVGRAGLAKTMKLHLSTPRDKNHVSDIITFWRKIFNWFNNLIDDKGIG